MSVCDLGLSCEPPPCEHGIQTRVEACHFCKLQKQIMALTDMYKELSIRVVAYCDFKIRQIDENRKISKRMDEIESKLTKKIEKSPHKCPLCDGCGIRKNPFFTYKQGQVDVTCTGCDGKGIVWG